MKTLVKKLRYQQMHNLRRDKVLFNNELNEALREMEIEYQHHMAKYREKYFKSKHSRRLYQ
jgi:hypothetical protein